MLNTLHSQIQIVIYFFIPPKPNQLTITFILLCPPLRHHWPRLPPILSKRMHDSSPSHHHYQQGLPSPSSKNTSLPLAGSPFTHIPSTPPHPRHTPFHLLCLSSIYAYCMPIFIPPHIFPQSSSPQFPCFFVGKIQVMLKQTFYEIQKLIYFVLFWAGVDSEEVRWWFMPVVAGTSGRRPRVRVKERREKEDMKMRVCP